MLARLPKNLLSLRRVIPLNLPAQARICYIGTAPLTTNLTYSFAKISKKQKQRKKDKEDKKKAKEEIGDASVFDLNPI